MLYFTGTSNVTDNATKIYTSSCYNKETKSSMINVCSNWTSISVIFHLYTVFVHTSARKW